MQLGRYWWVTTDKVGAGRTEILFCGQVDVAEIWVMADGIHWRLGPDGGVWGAHLDRPFWSEDGFDDVRTMINGRVRG